MACIILVMSTNQQIASAIVLSCDDMIKKIDIFLVMLEFGDFSGYRKTDDLLTF